VIFIDLAGKLITLEGLDFTGKSTLIRHLELFAREKGCDVISTREPGGTPVGERVRKLLLTRQHDEMLPLSELLLFMVSRAQHAHEVILPALRAGKTVLTSRYRLSSMAYQGYGRGIDLELIRSLNDAATEGREADLTFLIDVPVDVALGRKRGEGDRIEKEDRAFYQRVRNGYLEMADDHPRVHVVDGTGTIEEVFTQITDRLDPAF
jgi:dTMP kinase